MIKLALLFPVLLSLLTLAQENIPLPTARPDYTPKPSLYNQTPYQACGFLTSHQQRSNCLNIFKHEGVDKDALLYTLNYLQQNQGGIKDPSCAERSAKRAGIPAKIRNRCSFVFNQVETQFEDYKYRTQAFYINLCAGREEQIVRPFYANKGTGPDYVDVDHKKSTVAGAFVTDNKLRSFVPYEITPQYEAMKATFDNLTFQEKAKKNHDGEIPALDLTPMHSTNNDSLDDKPLHASPYKSSHGCPSVGPEDCDILSELAKNGPSLWINYGTRELHPDESIYQCDAIPESQVTETAEVIHKAKQSKTYKKSGKGGKKPATQPESGTST